MKNLPEFKQKEWTFFDEIKISQKETIMAEILRYFFTPKAEHTLKDNFIKALLKSRPRYLNEKKYIETSSYNNKQEEYYKKVQQLLNEDFTKDTSVETEVYTFNNNRIDIVINSEKLVLVIEFKINRTLDNPLNDYVDFIKCQGKINNEGTTYKENEINSFRCNKFKGKDKYFIVLTPFWKKPKEKNDDFVQITLAEFVANVENETGSFWDNKKDSQQYFIYKDFINTIKNRGLIINAINDIIQEGFNQDEIELLYKSEQLNNNQKKFLDAIKNAFNDKTKELLKSLKSGFQPLNATKDKIQSAIVKKLGNQEVKIRLSLTGWCLEVWNGDKTINKQNIGDFFSNIDDLVNIIKKELNS